MRLGSVESQFKSPTLYPLEVTVVVQLNEPQEKVIVLSTVTIEQLWPELPNSDTVKVQKLSGEGSGVGKEVSAQSIVEGGGGGGGDGIGVTGKAFS